MANRKTPEELQAEIDTLQAEIDKPEDPKPEESSEEKETEIEISETKETEEIETEVTTDEEEKEEPEQSEDEKDSLKKKLSASARENQKILAKNRIINKALDEAEEITEPTEEEMIAKYGDNWDVMSDLEKEQAKELLISKRFRETMLKAREQGKKIEKWNEDVEKFVENPQTFIDYPELEGKQDDFKIYAIDESNNSVPFKVLVSAFLHEQSTKKEKHKGAMFETGTGGSKEKYKPKPDKISIEEAARIKETNYNKYKELLMAGKIDESI